MDALSAAVAYAGLGLTVVGLWLTWFYGQRTCALLKGLVRRDSHK
jgi:hypothetical protein